MKFFALITLLSTAYTSKCVECPCSGNKCKIEDPSTCAYNGGDCNCIFVAETSTHMSECAFDPSNVCRDQIKSSSNSLICKDLDHCHASCRECSSSCIKSDPSCCLSCAEGYQIKERSSLGSDSIYTCEQTINHKDVCTALNEIQSKGANWLHTIYFHGDNNLEDFVFLDMKELLNLSAKDAEDVFNGKMRVIAVYDRNSPVVVQSKFFAPPLVTDCINDMSEPFIWNNKSDAYMFELVAIKNELNVIKLHLAVFDHLGEIDMASETELSNFVTTTLDRVTNVKKVSIILWDHGLSFMGYGGDDDAHSRLISTKSILRSLERGLANSSSGRKSFDIVAFDACLMGGSTVIEYASKISDVVIASQDLIPAVSYPYQVLSASNHSNGEPLTAEAVAQKIVNGYNESVIYRPKTLAAWKSSGIQEFTQSFKHAVDVLFSCGGQSDVPAYLLSQARNLSKKVPNCEQLCGSCLDMSSFLVNVIKQINKYVQKLRVSLNPKETTKISDMDAENEQSVTIELIASMELTAELFTYVLLQLTSSTTMISRTNAEFSSGQEGVHMFFPSVLELVNMKDKMCLTIIKYFEKDYADSAVGHLLDHMGIFTGIASIGGTCTQNATEKSMVKQEYQHKVLMKKLKRDVDFEDMINVRRELAASNNVLNEIQESEIEHRNDLEPINDVIEFLPEQFTLRIRTFEYYEKFQNSGQHNDVIDDQVEIANRHNEGNSRRVIPVVFHLIGDSLKGGLMITCRTHAEEKLPYEYHGNWNGTVWTVHDSSCNNECFPPFTVYMEEYNNNIYLPGLLKLDNTCGPNGCPVLATVSNHKIESIIFDNFSTCTKISSEMLSEAFFAPVVRPAVPGSAKTIPTGYAIPHVLPFIKVSSVRVKNVGVAESLFANIASLAYISMRQNLVPLDKVDVRNTSEVEKEYFQLVEEESSNGDNEINVICKEKKGHRLLVKNSKEIKYVDDLDKITINSWLLDTEKFIAVNHLTKHQLKGFNYVYNNKIESIASLSGAIGIKTDKVHNYIETIFDISNSFNKESNMENNEYSRYLIDEKCAAAASRGECNRKCEHLNVCPQAPKLREEYMEPFLDNFSYTYSPPFIGDETCKYYAVSPRSLNQIHQFIINTHSDVDYTFVLRCFNREKFASPNDSCSCDNQCVVHPSLDSNSTFCMCDDKNSGDGKVCLAQDSAGASVLLKFSRENVDFSVLKSLILNANTVLKKSMEGFPLPTNKYALVKFKFDEFGVQKKDLYPCLVVENIKKGNNETTIELVATSNCYGGVSNAVTRLRNAYTFEYGAKNKWSRSHIFGSGLDLLFSSSSIIVQ